jgi:hypothetical protein
MGALLCRALLVRHDDHLDWVCQFPSSTDPDLRTPRSQLLPWSYGHGVMQCHALWYSTPMRLRHQRLALMLLSGMVWTYIIGTAAGIASTLNPNKVLFHTTMDQLNYFMRERELSRSMRRELRAYFERARTVREVNDDANLLQAMSPLLRGTVAYAANRHWIARIWYLSSMPKSRDTREFIAHLASSLSLAAYIAEERPPIGQLYVLRRGMCVKNWRFLRAGSVWGDDMIINTRDLYAMPPLDLTAIPALLTVPRTHHTRCLSCRPAASRHLRPYSLTA